MFYIICYYMINYCGRCRGYPSWYRN